MVAALAFAGIGGVLAGPAQAGIVINVPASAPTIEAGIDVGSHGDTVLVAPGTYVEHIDFKGKAIEVRSSAGPRSTVIGGGGTSVVVVFKSGETRSPVLNGFTITHGLLGSEGGPGLISGAGVGINDASPINYVPGLTVPNLVVVKVAPGARPTCTTAGGSTHLVADVAGWFAG